MGRGELRVSDNDTLKAIRGTAGCVRSIQFERWFVQSVHISSRIYLTVWTFVGTC